jgi:hypothetical protein
MKFNYPQKAINKAEKEIKDLMKKIIRTKKGGKGNNAAKRDSGNLQDNIKPILTINKTTGEVEIDIQVMEYYQYLDEGTVRIKKPWFYTGELMSRVEFTDAIADLIAAGFEETTIDILSKLAK